MCVIPAKLTQVLGDEKGAFNRNRNQDGFFPPKASVLLLGKTSSLVLCALDVGWLVTCWLAIMYGSLLGFFEVLAGNSTKCIFNQF